ncbi:hypothetical protein LJC36_04930, partial [Desulfovibrio sp. OttesenSCG-928-C14]|nr:hypothetical protein [Desulfovibrio sp. OttesenSCG-928-C14]
MNKGQNSGRLVLVKTGVKSEADALADAPEGGLAKLEFTQILAGGLPDDLYYCESCSSTFDLGWELVRNKLLGEWGAALAFTQSSGRGQLRREWASPRGNLYVSFRLPGAFLAWEGASVMAAQLLLLAFGRLGLPLKLKWPNDLVLESPGAAPGKVGGVLLEERDGALLCGLGLNAAELPPAAALREGRALDPALLPKSFYPRDPLGLWLMLVQRLKMVYQEFSFAASPADPLPAILIRGAEDNLLWKGLNVQIDDPGNSDTPMNGKLLGLSPAGGLLLAPSFAALAG